MAEKGFKKIILREFKDIKSYLVLLAGSVLLCILRRRDLPHLKSQVAFLDPNAFIFVTDVREVLGEGFFKHV